MLKKNEGTIDRVIRFVLAVVFGVAAYLWFTGTVATVLYVLAAVMLLTSITGFCGLYKLIHMDTTGGKKA